MFSFKILFNTRNNHCSPICR